MSSAILPTAEQALARIPDLQGKWGISVSFGKSRSKNLERAVFLAKHSPSFFEDEDVYQATYSSSPSEYLQFIQLYEMVAGWKSTMVTICGRPVDRKIVCGINYCYGDKCRSGDLDFCHGASYMTKNPFGCHRLQISTCNNPWWSFGSMDSGGVWHIDISPILKRICSYSEIYCLCPAFSKDKILDGLNGIPKTINPKFDKGWEYYGGGVAPRDSMHQYSMRISVDLDLGIDNKKPPSQSKATSREYSLRACLFIVFAICVLISVLRMTTQ